MAKYSLEEKLEAVLRVIEDGMSKQQSAKILGVHKSRVHQWVQLYIEHGQEGLVMKNGSYTGEFKQRVPKPVDVCDTTFSNSQYAIMST